MNFYLSKMNELGADGIDFVPLVDNGTVYASFTRDAFIDDANLPCTPKTNYKFWKWSFGRKCYITESKKHQTNYERIISMNVDAMAENGVIKLPLTMYSTLYVSAFTQTPFTTREECLAHNEEFLNKEVNE